MSIRKAKRRRLKKYSIGDLREYIAVYDRNSEAPDFDDIDVRENFVKVADEWAFVQSLDVSSGGASGLNFFDDVNLDNIPSHLMVIRFKNYTSENFIQYQGQRYEIVKTVNPENKNMYLEMYVRQMGDENLPVNQ
jgi:hypothetical protein